MARLQATLDSERTARRNVEAELGRVRQQGMSDAEKAIDAARAEGRAEAERAAALVVAGAEFRVAAAGRIANPEAALAALDLAKLVDANGQPDKRAIAKLVDQLAAVPPPPAPGGHVPPGPREIPANGDTDWLRAIKRPTR